eukprot:1066001-Amphidinium_carterae.4
MAAKFRIGSLKLHSSGIAQPSHAAHRHLAKQWWRAEHAVGSNIVWVQSIYSNWRTGLGLSGAIPASIAKVLAEAADRA